MFNPRAVLAAPAALVLALLTVVPYISAQGPGTDPAVARLLTSIKARDTGQLAVSEEDGRFLRLMVASSGAKRALEIGGASGYSAIWIGMGLRSTGGKLVTIEYEAARAKELEENIRKAGLSDIVTSCLRRRVRADSTARGDVRFRVPRRVEARLQAFFRPRISAGWTAPGCSSPTTSSTSAARWETFSTRCRGIRRCGRRSSPLPVRGCPSR